MTIKVMYIVSTLKKVGPINQLLYIIKNLDKSKFYPMIVTLSPEPVDSSYSLFVDCGIEVHQIGLSRLKGMLFLQKRINNTIDDFKPHIIQTHGFRADRLKINSGVPKLIVLRTSVDQAIPFSVKPKYLGQKLAEILFKLHLNYVKKCDYVVVCSKSLSEDYNKILGRKFKFIQNGVDTRIFLRPLRKKKEELRKKFNLLSKKKIYLSLNNLHPFKNTNFIIEVFKKWDYLNNSILIILGDGVEREKIERSIKGHNNIKIFGHITSVFEYIQLSDYLISASRGEGLPNVVLEAMSSGLPCILSDIPPHLEILNGSNSGLTFENNNSKDLKEKIIQINKFDYNLISKASRDHINKCFSDKKMSLKYQHFYEDILKSK